MTDPRRIFVKEPNISPAWVEEDLGQLASELLFVTVGFSDATYLCDGVDDDIQIQEAVDYVNSNGGGSIYIKHGNYSLSNEILINKTIKIFGDGRTTNLNVSSSINAITIDATTGAIIGLTLKDLQLSGHNAGSFGIQLKSTGGFELTQIHFENLAIDGFDTQIEIDVATGLLCTNVVAEYGWGNNKGINTNTTGRIECLLDRPWFEGLTTGLYLSGQSYFTVVSPQFSTGLTNEFVLATSGGNNPELAMLGYLGSQANLIAYQTAAIRIHNVNSTNGVGELRFADGSANGSSRIGFRFTSSNKNLAVRDFQNGVDRITITQSGKVGINETSPTSQLHLGAGVAASGGAPLKFTAGTNLSTPEDGAFEFDGTHLYFTIGGVRQTIL